MPLIFLFSYVFITYKVYKNMPSPWSLFSVCWISLNELYFDWFSVVHSRMLVLKNGVWNYFGKKKTYKLDFHGYSRSVIQTECWFHSFIHLKHSLNLNLPHLCCLNFILFRVSSIVPVLDWFGMFVNWQ